MSINLSKKFLRISRIRKITVTWILARVFAYFPFSFLSFWTLSIEQSFIFILIYFKWRDTENQQWKVLIINCEFKKVLNRINMPKASWTIFPVPWSQRLSFILYWEILRRKPLLLFLLSAWSGESAESLWSRPSRISLSCHQLLTVVSDKRIFLITLRVIWLDLSTNCKFDPPLWLVKRKWNLWQLSSAEQAWKWDSQRSRPEAFSALTASCR